MEVKEFKSFDEYKNYVESDSYNELVPTIIIDENYCAIDFTTYCKSWKTAIRRAMKIFSKYEDVYNWLVGMKESCENNCFNDRSVYDGKYTGDFTFGVEEVSDGVFYIYLKYRTTETETYRDRINSHMETHSFPLISEMYNDKCFCCPADRKGNECKGKETCGKTWKRYEAIINPEWHHVSLSTLANLDFDMLDEKRQTYFTVYRDLQQTLLHLRNCKTVNTYSACYNRFVKSLNVIRGKSKITNAMYKYIEAKLSMQNVESGLWASAWEAATGSHESRRYNKCRA